MSEKLNPWNRIRKDFPIHELCLSLPILSLKSTLLKEEKEATASRMIKVLRKAGYITIGDIVNGTWEDLKMVNGLGYKTHSMLLNVLQRITADPTLILNFEGIKKIEQKELNQEEREKRIKNIKKRLREMGMIK